MKKTLLSLITLALLSVPFTSFASDDIYNMSIKDAMTDMPAKVKSQIGDFKFYFGKDSRPSDSSKVGAVEANVRTNAFLKGATKSCNWAFYSALIKLKKQSGDGKAIANIQSNWKNNLTSSSDTFACGKGFLMSGVVLKGEAIK